MTHDDGAWCRLEPKRAAQTCRRDRGRREQDERDIEKRKEGCKERERGGHIESDERGVER